MRDIILRNPQNARKHKVFVWEFSQEILENMLNMFTGILKILYFFPHS